MTKTTQWWWSRGARCAAVGLVASCSWPAIAQSQPLPSAPRIAPIESSPATWTDEVRNGVRAFAVEPEEAPPLLRTLARHPAALNGIGPLAGYIRSRAVATAVDQVLIGLRIAWLCRSEVVWGDQVREARALGLSEAEIRRVAEGPNARDWSGQDSTVLRAADDIYRDAFLGDETWAIMARRYNAPQMIDVVFTAAEYMMLSMLSNSFGVQPDPESPDRLPVDVARESIARERRGSAWLKAPRLEPVPRGEWTPVQRELLDPSGSGRPILNLYMTLARHPAFYRPRAIQSQYIRTGSTLSGRVREMLILRIGWLTGAEYEWAHHVPIARSEGLTNDEIDDIARGPSAPAWSPVEATLLSAADELHDDDTISDETWAALSETLDERELIDVVITVAGYKMVGVALNSLGVQLEPGLTGFPN